MARLCIHHETLYAYERPVRFAPHRLLVRPRDSHAIRIVEASLTLPPGKTRWQYDALGNSICWFEPTNESTSLSIVSDLVIERFPAPLAPMRIRRPQTATPIVYETSDRHVVAPFMEPLTDDPEGELLDWVRSRIGRPDEPVLDFVRRLNTSIRDDFVYQRRHVGPPQDPAETVRCGSGTCRDFAWLMVESLRRLGYAARFVTGYLYSPRTEIRGAGATHAWCEVFLPDYGWTEFDPTNALVESADLIPVAVTRTTEEAAPVTGGIFGNAGRSTLTVHVDVRSLESLPAAA